MPVDAVGGLGVLGAGYNFMLSLHVPEATYLGAQPWVGESGVIITAAGLGALAWIAGLLLMYQVGNWHPTAAAIWTGNCNEGQGCSLAGYRHAAVSWEELAVLAGWLALGAAMALILASTRSLRTRDIRGISSA